MNSREKDSKSIELWEKRLRMYIRRDSMQQKPNICQDADESEEFYSGELDTVTDEVTLVHPACFELFSSFTFICHPAVSDVTACLPLLEALV